MRSRLLPLLAAGAVLAGAAQPLDAQHHAQAAVIPKDQLIVFDVLDSIPDPCTSPYGPNVITFVKRGAGPWDDTRVYGVDLCTKQLFEYVTATGSTMMTGFDANPVRIYWADPADSINLHRDRFEANVMGGVEFGALSMIINTDSVFLASGAMYFAPTVAVRYGKFKLSAALPAPVVSPGTYFGRISITPFKRWGPRRLATYDENPYPTRPGERGQMRYFGSIGELCNGTHVGVRGFYDLRVTRLIKPEGDSVKSKPDNASGTMVSLCSHPYVRYHYRLRTDRYYFENFNNTTPRLADWDYSADKSFLSNLVFTVGFGNIRGTAFRSKANSMPGSTINVPVFYTGIGYIISDNRWWIEVGGHHPLKQITVPIGGVVYPVRIDGWSVQVQRTFSLNGLFK